MLASRFFRYCDKFITLPTFRAKEIPEFGNMCAGIFSFILSLFFFYVFVNGLVSMINLENISVNMHEEMNRLPNQSISNIAFAFGIPGVDIRDLEIYFSFNALIATSSSQTTPIELRMCTREDWPLVDDKSLDHYGIEKCLCALNKGDISFKGFFSSSDEDSEAFALLIQRCSNQTFSGVCATDLEFQNFMNSIEYGFLIGQILLMDVAFNPTEEKPVNYFINENLLWVPFGGQTLIQMIIRLGQWTVTTDTNFLPFESNEEQKGYFIDSIFSSFLDRDGLPFFAEIYLFNSRTQKIINREYGKFDSLLSYIGGLFGILTSFFAFFMISYNEYRYQLWLGEGLLNQKKGKRFPEKNFHFPLYLKYVVFDWINVLFAYQMDWETCRKVDETRNEAIEQLQTQFIVRRLGHLESAMNVMFSKEDNTCLHLMEHSSIERIIKNRKLAAYYKLMAESDEEPMTIYRSNLEGEPKNSLEDNSFIQLEELIKNKVSLEKSQLKEGQSLTSLEMMEKFMKAPEKEVELDEEDQQIEDEIIADFYKMDEQVRKKVVLHIPLTILYRIHQRRAREDSELIDVGARGDVKKVEVKQRKLEPIDKKKLTNHAKNETSQNIFSEEK